jgi:hypothetical protein
VALDGRCDLLYKCMGIHDPDYAPGCHGQRESKGVSVAGRSAGRTTAGYT